MKKNAVLLTDPDGRILSSDAEARALLGRENGLLSRDGRLLISPNNASGQTGEVLRPSGECAYRIEMTALGTDEQPASQYLVSIEDVERAQVRRREILDAAYSLSVSEMRLAEALLDGCTTVRAAERLGLSIHTIRTYLKRLYDKVGVRTQATLLRELLKELE